MKTTISLLLVLMFAITAFSQDNNYLNNKLTVEVRNMVVGRKNEAYTSSYYSNTVEGSSTYTSTELTKWQGYRGGIALSELDFYKVAGINRQVENIRRYRENKQKQIDNAQLASLLGTCVWLLFDTTLKSWVGWTGLLMLVDGAQQARKYSSEINNQITPASFAVEVADNYNKQLLSTQ